MGSFLDISAPGMGLDLARRLATLKKDWSSCFLSLSIETQSKKIGVWINRSRVVTKHGRTRNRVDATVIFID